MWRRLWSRSMAQLVEFRRSARPHEAAVARQQRRILLEAQSEAVDQAGQRHEALGDRPQRLLVADELAQAVGRRQPVRDRQQIARVRHARAPSGRAPAPDRGSGAARGAAPRSAAEVAIRLSTWSSRSRIGWACARGAASRSASSLAPALVTVRSIAASSEPLRPPAEAGVKLQIAPRRRIDQQDTVRLQAPRPVQPWQQSLLSELQIAQKGACRGKLGPPELAQAIQGGDAELAAQPPFGGDAVEVRVGERRHGHADLAARRVQLGSQSVGQQQLAGPQARQHRGQLARVRQLGHERTGRDVDSGEAELAAARGNRAPASCCGAGRAGRPRSACPR